MKHIRHSVKLLSALLLICASRVSAQTAENTTEAISSEFRNAIHGMREQFDQVSSVDFRAHCETFLGIDAKVTPYYVRDLYYRGHDDKFWFRYRTEDVSRKVALGSEAAFDGKLYQTRQGTGRLVVSSRLPEHLSTLAFTDGLFMPYEFLKLPKPEERSTLLKGIRISDLRTSVRWDAIPWNGGSLRLEQIENERTLVASFKATHFDQNASMSVWFSLPRGGFPVKWQLRYEDEKIRGFDYAVTKVGIVDLGGKKIYYPETALLTQWCGENQPSSVSTIRLTGISFNSVNDDEVFTFDAASFGNIYDADTNTSIPVPR